MLAGLRAGLPFRSNPSGEILILLSSALYVPLKILRICFTPIAWDSPCTTRPLRDICTLLLTRYYAHDTIDMILLILLRAHYTVNSWRPHVSIVSILTCSIVFLVSRGRIGHYAFCSESKNHKWSLGCAEKIYYPHALCGSHTVRVKRWISPLRRCPNVLNKHFLFLHIRIAPL